MSFSFGNESIKKWNRSIMALSRIGENLTWEITSESLNLSVMNASGLSHMTISFLPQFFDRFTRPPVRMTFRTASKGIFNISKRMDTDGSVKDCHVKVCDDHTLSIQTECANHIKRTYYIAYEMLRSVPVIPDGTYTSSFALLSKRFREFVEHLKGEQVEVKWDPMDLDDHEQHYAVSMKSVTAPIKGQKGRVIRQAVNTRLKISAGIFDDLSPEGGTVGIPMVDLKHFLGLSESLMGTSLCQFGDENTPARFELVTESLNGPNDIECVLHFMNMTSEATVARSRRVVRERGTKLARYDSLSSMAETVDDNYQKEDEVYYDDTVLNYPEQATNEVTEQTEVTTEMDATGSPEYRREDEEEEPLFLDDDYEDPIQEMGPTQTTRVTGILDGILK